LSTIYFSCSILNVSLNAIIYKYLVSLLTITSIELYCFLVAESINLDNLIIKSIVILFYNTSDSFWY